MLENLKKQLSISDDSDYTQAVIDMISTWHAQGIAIPKAEERYIMSNLTEFGDWVLMGFCYATEQFQNFDVNVWHLGERMQRFFVNAVMSVDLTDKEQALLDMHTDSAFYCFAHGCAIVGAIIDNTVNE